MFFSINFFFLQAGKGRALAYVRQTLFAMSAAQVLTLLASRAQKYKY